MAPQTASIASFPALPVEDLRLVCAMTAPLWEEMRGRSLFITGGTGFFGCWLVESFCHINRALDLKARATVLTRDPAAFRAKCPHLVSEPSLALIAGDVRDFEFPGGNFQYVVHAATETVVESTLDAQLGLLHSIVAGTERLLQFAAARGTRKFLLTSSGAVYGPQPPHIANLPETYAGAPDALAPGSAYGEGKRLAELLCALYGGRNGFDCKIARCWAFSGPHLSLDRHFAIGNFIADALAGRSIQIKGDGTPVRSYLYAADLAVWLWTMLFRAPALMPINIGSSRGVSILELARAVAGAINPKVEVEVANTAAPGVLPPRYVPSVDRAQETLGLRQTVGLEEGIRRTAEWHRRRPHL